MTGSTSSGNDCAGKWKYGNKNKSHADPVSPTEADAHISQQENEHDGLDALADREVFAVHTNGPPQGGTCASGHGTGVKANVFFNKAPDRKTEGFESHARQDQPRTQPKDTATAKFTEPSPVDPKTGEHVATRRSNPFYRKNSDRKSAMTREWQSKHAAAIQSAPHPPIVRRIPSIVEPTEENPFFIRDVSRKAAKTVEIELSFLAQSLDELVSEYLNLKFLNYVVPISRFCLTNRTLAYETHTLRANNLERSVSCIASDIWEQFLEPRISARRKLEQDTSQLLLVNQELAYKIYDLRADQLEQSLFHLKRCSRDGLFGPRLSARHNVDQLLKRYEETEKEYIRLKDRFTKASIGLSAIRAIVRALARDFSKMPFERREYWALKDYTLSVMHSDFQRISHAHRAYVRQRLKFGGSYAADIWEVRNLLVEPREMERSTGNAVEVTNTLFEACESGNRLEAYTVIFPDECGRVYRGFYLPLMSMPKASLNPVQNMQLRQLDVLAPIQMVLESGLTIEHELQYLIRTLYEHVGLWTWLSSRDLKYYRLNFKSHYHRVGNCRAEMAVLFTDYGQVHWTRLEINRKLRATSLLDSDSGSGSVAVSNPISKDATRFKQWVHAIRIERMQQKLVTNVKNLHSIDGKRYKGARLYDYYSPVPPSLLQIRAIRAETQKSRNSAAAGLQIRRYATVSYQKSRSFALGAAAQGMYYPSTAFTIGGLRTMQFSRGAIRSYSWGSLATKEAALRQQNQSKPDSPASISAKPSYWSHRLHKGPDGKAIVVHYCRSLASTEEIAKHFLDDKVIGFDLEWNIQASNDIQSNLSLIQIANDKRVALFHIAQFKPATGLHDFVAPTLCRILESPEVTKVGVSIKADCTRLRKYLGIDAQGIFELSHLHRLVKYSQTSPKLVNKRLVNLSEQVEEHFGLPLLKDGDVRCSDWSRFLNYDQVQYAATDPFACICLFNTMDHKRQLMVPAPPRPAHAELGLPIRLAEEEDIVTKVSVKQKTKKVVEVSESTTTDLTINDDESPR